MEPFAYFLSVALVVALFRTTLEGMKIRFVERPALKGRWRGKKPPGYIYWVRGRRENPLYVKVGRTNNLERRVKTFATANVHGMALLASLGVKDDRKAEAALHKKFAPLRVRNNGEWFKVSAYFLFFMLLVRD